jgi:flagellar biosynthesis GTPase FlhF
MLEYEPVGVLGSEVERLREGILAQLQALRWQVVDFSITDALRSVSEADGVVELRLRVSSNVWRESAEAERQKRMEEACEEKRIAEAKQEEEEEQQIREAEERQQQQDQARAEEEAKERQRTLENEEKENREKESDVAAASSAQDGLRLQYEWDATKEKARQKVFDAVRKEQDRRMLFALNLRESLGLKVRLRNR